MSRRVADELLEQFVLSKWAKASVYALSGGMAQRLMVARAIFHRPAVLFMDEPTAGLDPQSRLALWEILGKLNEQGQTILLTTHYMEEADQLCDRLRSWTTARSSPSTRRPSSSRASTSTRSSTVRASGGPEELAALLESKIEGAVRTRLIEGGLELFVRNPGHGLLPRVVDVAEGAGIVVNDLSVSETTLETVFISLTGKELPRLMATTATSPDPAGGGRAPSGRRPRPTRSRRSRRPTPPRPASSSLIEPR